MKRWQDILLIVALLSLSAAPRFAGLGSFTSVDEPFWLRQGANFYYALGQRQFANTIYEYHPAVTTMWVVAAGMLTYFPEYRALGQGYLKPGKFDAFLPAHGKDPLQLLIVSRGLQVIVIVGLLLLVYFLLRRLFDARSAFLATSFISVSPFVLGHSRLLNHEAFLGLFILISLLSLLVYLWHGHRFAALLVSGICAALAQLTKSSGFLLFALIAFVLAIDVLMARGPSLWRAFLERARVMAIWLMITAAGYVLFWPGMWVAPGKMLYEVYGNALSYTFQGARLSVVPGLDPGAFGLDTVFGGLRLYLSDLAWRTTPLTWLGLALGIALAILYQRRRTELHYRLLALDSLALAAAFVLLFSVQRGPKPPHYILTSYMCMELVAGLGVARGWDLLRRRFAKLDRAAITGSIFGAFLAFQLGSSLTAYPYFMSYYNPVMEAMQPGTQNPTLAVTGYGVGLDQAAGYLSQKPAARNLTVMSANGYGCFSYYFQGTTVPMNSLVLSDPELVSILRGSEYAVVDHYNQTRNGLKDGLDGIPPEKIIRINGYDFLYIYRASDLLSRVDSAAQ